VFGCIRTVWSLVPSRYITSLIVQGPLGAEGSSRSVSLDDPESLVRALISGSLADFTFIL